MVTVGNAGNAAAGAGNTTHGQTDAYGYGAVAYDYRIGRTEVTLNEYVTFLNAVASSDPYGLYIPDDANALTPTVDQSGNSGSYSYEIRSGWSGELPVVSVTWFQAARFTNWLHNGAKGTSDTETGAYTLNGAMTGIITKNPDALYWIPTEDEWYKAAYYDPTLNGGTGGYTLHANGSDTMTSNTIGDSGAANYFDGGYSTGSSGDPSTGPTTITEVGVFINTSNYYGTFDQAGNLAEWNDAVIGSDRGLRGGSWESSDFFLGASSRSDYPVDGQSPFVGFRVAAIPEPSTIIMLALTGLAMGITPLYRRLRRRRKIS